eukprot:UN15511
MSNDGDDEDPGRGNRACPFGCPLTIKADLNTCPGRPVSPSPVLLIYD